MSSWKSGLKQLREAFQTSSHSYPWFQSAICTDPAEIPASIHIPDLPGLPPENRFEESFNFDSHIRLGPLRRKRFRNVLSYFGSGPEGCLFRYKQLAASAYKALRQRPPDEVFPGFEFEPADHHCAWSIALHYVATSSPLPSLVPKGFVCIGDLKPENPDESYRVALLRYGVRKWIGQKDEDDRYEAGGFISAFLWYPLDVFLFSAFVIDVLVGDVPEEDHKAVPRPAESDGGPRGFKTNCVLAVGLNDRGQMEVRGQGRSAALSPSLAALFLRLVVELKHGVDGWLHIQDLVDDRYLPSEGTSQGISRLRGSIQSVLDQTKAVDLIQSSGDKRVRLSTAPDCITVNRASLLNSSDQRIKILATRL